MKNPLAFLNSIQLGKPNGVLALHSDGCQLRGAVVRSGIGGGALSAAAASRALDCRTALAEVLGGLRSQGIKKPPKSVVMVSACAMPALIELPIDPASPRPQDQMHELVRWEMETLFSEQGRRWSIGSLLMGRGYLDAAQRAEVAAEQALRNRSDADAGPDGPMWLPGPGKTVRFGDLAVDLGHVTREQAEECATLQQRLVQVDDDLVCGWAGQQVTVDDDQEEGDPRFPWLATAVPESTRRNWVKVCAREGLFLSAIYPRLGAGFSALKPDAGRDLLYVEVHDDQTVVMSGRPGALRGLRIEANVDGRADGEQVAMLCAEQMGSDIETIRLQALESGVDASGAGLASELEARLARRVVPVSGNEQLAAA